MRRILLSTLGTLGDVIPFARLAERLLARGHEVTVHSWQQFATWFPAGTTFVAIAEGVDAGELHATLDEALRAPTFVTQKQRFARMFYGLGDGTTRARAGYERARQVIAGQDFAVINVLDHVAQLAAIDAGVPWASYASRPPPALGDADPLNAELDDELSELLASVTGKRRRVRMFREFSERLAFAACSPQLLPDELRHVIDATGPWLARAEAPAPLPPALDAFVSDGDCLFATFGTMPDVFGRTAALIAGAAASGWRAVVQVLPPLAVPDRVPERVFVLRDRVAFDALVPRVVAVVHHGSVGTTHEVLRAGKPSFVVPHMGDQFFWAHMLYVRGLAPQHVPHVMIQPNVIAERMAALRDPRLAQNAAALAPVIAAQDGVGRAAERIEEVA